MPSELVIVAGTHPYRENWPENITSKFFIVADKTAIGSLIGLNFLLICSGEAFEP